MSSEKTVVSWSVFPHHSSLLTPHFSLLTAHCSLLTPLYSLFTVHYSLLSTVYCLPSTVYSLLTAHYSLLTTHYSLPLTHLVICVPRKITGNEKFAGGVAHGGSRVGEIPRGEDPPHVLPQISLHELANKQFPKILFWFSHKCTWRDTTP